MDKTEELQEYLTVSSLLRETVSTRGWEFVKSYYEQKVKALATGIIVSDSPIQDFEAERNEIKGIRKLMSEIDERLRKLREAEQNHAGEH